MFIRLKYTLASTLVFLLLAACGGAPTPPIPETPVVPETPAVPQKQVSIESLGWVIENDEPSRSPDGATAFLRPSVKFTDTDLEAGDFASIRVISPEGGSWVYDDAEDFERGFYEESNFFRMGGLYAARLDGGSYIALGDYTVEVTLKNGNSTKKTLFVPAPGSTETDGYEFAYTENHSGAANPPSNFVALPKRATIQSAALDTQASSLKVDFSAQGDAVYSGWVEAYNAQGDYIGYFGDFRDYKTGTLMPQLNTGTALFTDGTTTNALSVSAEQMTIFDTDTTSFSDIASILIVLTDGEQYAGTESMYDVITISEEVDVSLNN